MIFGVKGVDERKAPEFMLCDIKGEDERKTL